MANLRRYILIAITTAILLASCNSLTNQNVIAPTGVTTSPTVSVVVITPETTAPMRIPDVPYLQTPYEVVSKMLGMAKVKASDTVYDLGSGDGRIAIAATRDYEAKAIGIEIDPELIRESTREAQDAIARMPSIRDHLKFIQQDFFKADISDATVITLYLQPEVNLRILSEIIPKLKTGTRVVSHDYGLGNLQPMETAKIQIGDREHLIYLWTL